MCFQVQVLPFDESEHHCYRSTHMKNHLKQVWSVKEPCHLLLITQIENLTGKALGTHMLIEKLYLLSTEGSIIEYPAQNE